MLYGPACPSQERFEENADIVAIAKRAGGADSFPEYFHVARNMPEETELQVHEEAVRMKGKLWGCGGFPRLLSSDDSLGEMVFSPTESNQQSNNAFRERAVCI